MFHPGRHYRRGFTLIELLVTIGIIAILVAFVVVAISQSRKTALRTQCANNLRQIGLALHNYHAAHSMFPPGGVHMTTKRPGTVPEGDETKDGRAPWTVLLLPFLDETPRYNSFNFEAAFSPRFDKSEDTPEPNLTQQYLPFQKLHCPLDPNSGPEGIHSNYAVCQGGGLPEDAAERTIILPERLFYDNGLFYHNSSNGFRDVKDGTSNTVLAGETKYVGPPKNFEVRRAWWSWATAVRSHRVKPSLFNISATVDPINFPQNGEYVEEDILKYEGVFQGANHGGQQRVYGSYHQGGGNFLFVDGTVKFLNENLDLKTYRSLGARSDGFITAEF